MKRFLGPTLAVSVLIGWTAMADAVQISKEIPELNVLNRWVGKWDVEMTVKPNADVPKGMRSKGWVTTEWTLNFRFVQQFGTMWAGEGTPAVQIHSLMTYDPRKKAYRTWMFFSTGHMSESEGTWDEKTRTLTSKSRDADSGTTTTTKATFAEDGAETWSIITKDRDGKVVNETTGKNTRQKK